MGFAESHHSHWLHLRHPPTQTTQRSKSDSIGLVTSLYSLRMLGLCFVVILWVAFTLKTGIFSVAPVMLIGVAVGCAHLILPNRFNRAHLPSALYITVLGGLLANVLAGLAEFSSTLGVYYLQVVGSRRIPEDVPMLATAFVNAFRFEDAIFYTLAIAASCICLRKKD